MPKSLAQVSTATMISQLEGLLGTKDLKPDQIEFVEKLVRIRDSGQVTGLTDGQLDYLSGLWGRHFA